MKKEGKLSLLAALAMTAVTMIAYTFVLGGWKMGLFYLLFTAAFFGVNFLLYLGVRQIGKRRAAKITASVLICVLNFAVALGVSVYYLQGKLLFSPSNSVECFNTLKVKPEFEQVSITARDGTQLRGWLKKNTKNEPAPLVIYFGGNGQNSSQTFRNYLKGRVFEKYAGCNVMMMDYRSYGYSAGTPSDADMFSDAVDIYDFAVKQPYVEKSHVVSVGYSLGTGAATCLASQRKVAGLVLVAPYYDGQHLYNSMLDIFHGPMTALMRYQFDTKRYAPNVQVSPLIFTSKTDKMINYQQSEALAKKFKSVYKFVYIKGTGHNDYFGKTQMLNELSGYIHRVTGGAVQ
jgi:pimeloyl-ACP methyl ester carboxylesterase